MGLAHYLNGYTNKVFLGFDFETVTEIMVLSSRVGYRIGMAVCK